MDTTTNKRGGARRNAGRKAPEGPTLEVAKHTVSLDPMTVRLLRVLGAGNVSLGIRVAARHSYDAYQGGKLTLPQVVA